MYILVPLVPKVKNKTNEGTCDQLKSCKILFKRTLNAAYICAW